MKQIRRGLGVPLSTWLGHIPDEIRRKAPFQVWREFWQDDLCPQDAMIKVE